MGSHTGSAGNKREAQHIMEVLSVRYQMSFAQIAEAMTEHRDFLSEQDGKTKNKKAYAVSTLNRWVDRTKGTQTPRTFSLLVLKRLLHQVEADHKAKGTHANQSSKPSEVLDQQVASHRPFPKEAEQHSKPRHELETFEARQRDTEWNQREDELKAIICLVM